MIEGSDIKSNNAKKINFYTINKRRFSISPINKNPKYIINKSLSYCIGAGNSIEENAHIEAIANKSFKDNQSLLDTSLNVSTNNTNNKIYFNNVYIKEDKIKINSEKLKNKFNSNNADKISISN